MPVYAVYGRRLGSDIPLPELATVGGESDFLFRRGALAIGAERWFEIWPQPDGRPWIRGMKVSCGAAARKLRIRDGLPFASGPFPLTRLYVIDPSPAVSIRFEPLTARAALMELVQQTYRLALDDRDALASQFDVLADVVTRLSAWRVSFPRTLAGVSGLAESVGEHISDTARAPSAKASASPASAKATARQA
jgi:hypothetical protein